jgi:hypothetical protein
MQPDCKSTCLQSFIIFKFVLTFLYEIMWALKNCYAESGPKLKNVLCIHQALRNWEWQVNNMLEDLARVMDVKFDKYWNKGKYNMALVIATVHDSSKKMDFLNFFL